MSQVKRAQFRKYIGRECKQNVVNTPLVNVIDASIGGNIVMELSSV